MTTDNWQPATCNKQLATDTKALSMNIDEKHKKLLIELGIKEEDFRLFDGKTVTYEWEKSKGVRLYDPYYQTSYREYIDVDGWSSWSTEQVVFENEILPPARAMANQRAEQSPVPTREELAQAMKQKFGKRES